MRQTLARRTREVLMGALFLMVLAAHAAAADLNWSQTTGLLFYDTAGNWNPAQTPTATDNVEFSIDVAGNPIIIGASSDALNVNVLDNDWEFTGAAGGVLTSAGATTINDALGTSLVDGTNLDVTNNLTWHNTGNIIVGDTGYGSLTVEDGSNVDGLQIFVGNTANGVGELTLTGATTSLTARLNSNTGVYTIGRGGGTGTVNVLAGATLNTTSILGNDIWVGGHDTDDDIAAITSMGTLNVDGLGSFVETEDLNVGIFGGVGFLNITGGGVVNTADSTNADTQFGANDGFGGLKSTGTGVVDGDGSLLQSRSFLIGGSGTGTLEVRAGGRARTQISSALAGDATLGDNQGSNGKVAVHGTATDDTTASLLDVDDTLIVGDAGLGVLNIGRDLNGNEVGTGALQVDLQLLIGNAAGNTLDNKVVVSGANATANIGTNLQAGLSGKGIFEARNGATITVGGALGAGGLPAGNGTILIDGPGTTLTSSTMFLGNGNSGPLATGVMTVSDQAVVTFTSTANGVVTIGDDAFSAGTLTVTGAGSLVQSTGGTAEWWIGGSIADTGGAGTLNVLDGGQVTSTGRMVLGYIGGSTGYVTVDGTDSQVDANGDYILVGFNGVGNMDVTGGGVVNANRIFVADAVGSAGSELDITGPGSVVNIDRLLHVGDTVRGTVVVSAGGQLNVAVGVPTERLIIGDQGTADGSRLTVSGANSRVDYHGTADVAVGNAGGANTANINDRATLEVTAGGVFSAVQRNPDTSIASQARIIIGDVTGGNGRVLVDGAGSLVEASVIYVGDGDSASSGILDIQNGGTVTTTGEFQAGSNGAGVGTVNIDGNTATLDVGTTFSLGDDSPGDGTATGNLNITAGGTVTNGTQAYIGHFTGSFGTATLGSSTANTSSWSIGGELTLAGTETSSQTSGSGALNVNAGGRVDVASNLRIRNLGDVNLNGGEIAVGNSLLFTDAGSTFNFTSGTLRLTNAAGYTLSGSQLDGILGINHTLGANQHLAVDGTAVLSTPLRLNGGTFSVGAITAANLANLDFDAGTLNITAANVIVGAGGPFGSTLVIDSDQTINVTNAVSIQLAAQLVVAGTFSSGGLTNQGDLTAIDATIGGPVVNNNAVTVVGTVDFNGLVSGPGDFFGPGTANFNGGMAPGASPAEVAFEGSVALTDTNTLFIEIAGATPGSQYDRLLVAGDAALDGILDVSLIGFSPTLGQQFTVLTANSIVDNGLVLGGAAAGSFSLLVGSTSVILQALAAGLPGDYNQNGTVDAADYTVWRDNLGSGTSLPNDDTAGVAADDYERWKSHFGESAGSGSSISSHAAVPEPATLGMLAVALVAFVFRRWD